MPTRLRHLFSLAALLITGLGASGARAQVPAWQWRDLHNWRRNRVATSAGVVSVSAVHRGSVSVSLGQTAHITPWKRRLRVRGANATAMAHAKGRVFVALYSKIDTGATAVALDARRGAVLWRVRLRALGPVAHSQYLNELQMGIDHGNLVVYGIESSGRYIEVRDGATGRILGSARVARSLTSLPWNWHGSPQKHRWYIHPARLRAPGGGAFLFVNDRHGKSERVERRGRNHKRKWQRRLPGHASCGNAALARHRRTLYVVQFCSMATGATLHAIDTRTGKLRWSKPLIGIGPIGHSKYSNDVQLEIRNGMALIYGNESSGKYVEARDLGTGDLLMNRSFP